MIGSTKVLNNIIPLNPECKCAVQSICPSGTKIDVDGLYVQKLGQIGVTTTILDKKYNVFEYNFITFDGEDYYYSILFSKKGILVIEAFEGFESCPIIKLEKTNNNGLKIYRGWNYIDNLIYEYEISDSYMGSIKRTYVKYGEKIFDLSKMVDYIINLNNECHNYDSGYENVVAFSEKGLNELDSYNLTGTPYISGEYYDNRIFKLTLNALFEYIEDLIYMYILFFEELDCLVSIAKTMSGFIILLYHKGRYGAYIIHYNNILETLVASKKEEYILLYLQFRPGEEYYVKINIHDLIKNIDIEGKKYYDVGDIIKPLDGEGFCLVFSKENYRDYKLYNGERYIALYEIFNIPSKITDDVYFNHIMGINGQDMVFLGEKVPDFTYITPKYI